MIWLSAMPESLKSMSSEIICNVVKDLMPEPKTIKELLDTDFPYVMFDDLETGKTYELSGEYPDKKDMVTVKKFGTTELCDLPLETKIKSLF